MKLPLVELFCLMLSLVFFNFLDLSLQFLTNLVMISFANNIYY